jgi:putative membrane protein
LQLTYILALLFAVIVALFAILNAQAVTVDFLFGEFEVSLALVILISAFAGAIILGFLGLFRHVKTGFKLRDMQNKNKKLEERYRDMEDKLGQAEQRIQQLEEELASKDLSVRELEDRLMEQQNQLEALQQRLEAGETSAGNGVDSIDTRAEVDE